MHAVAGIEDVVGVPGDQLVVDVVVVGHHDDGVAATEELSGQRHATGDQVELVRADVVVVDSTSAPSSARPRTIGTAGVSRASLVFFL